ncbi:hypothetical protein K1719_028898 [Acacia pycnantha]|nr:hypothetical protein K1719_028898 [Acacia pycnantha]
MIAPQNLFLPCYLVKSLVQCSRKLRDFKPHVVIGIGGLVSFPHVSLLSETWQLQPLLPDNGNKSERPTYLGILIFVLNLTLFTVRFSCLKCENDDMDILLQKTSTHRANKKQNPKCEARDCGVPGKCNIMRFSNPITLMMSSKEEELAYDFLYGGG